MRKALLAIIFLIPLFLSAQNTWVRKLNYEIAMTGYYDTLTSVNQIEIGKDGDVYILAHIDQHMYQYLYKFNTVTRQVIWQEYVGFHGMAGITWAERIRPTADSGVVICDNFDDYSNGSVHGSICKYSRDGTLEWTTTFGGTFIDNTAYDIIENTTGGYFALIDDSMYTIDRYGSVTDTSEFIHGQRFQQLPNSDLLIKDYNTIYRADTLGNVIWSQPCSGVFDCDTSSVFLRYGYGSVKKVDAQTGSMIWSGNYFGPISEIEATHDGGFIGSVGYSSGGGVGTGGSHIPGMMWRADSLGDTLWTRTFNLPHYGLSTFKIMDDGNILTGGSYLSNGTEYILTNNYSSFMCMMNSDASYPLVQTGYISPPDANHDHFRNFVDDALTMMLALGQTGTPVDSSLDNHGPSAGVFGCTLSNIAIDWPTSASGVNDKYSDADGNGVVDTNDLHAFDYNIYCADSVPLYYRLSNPNQAQNVEEFYIVPVNDTILPGESPEYYLIMGTNANPVDSVYGFAVTYFVTEYGQNNVVYSNFYSSDLGTPGVDLFKMQGGGVISSQYERQRTLVCRTDFQNAVNVNDTIGYIRFGGYFFTDDIQLIITDFKAILVDGTEIPFNVSAGSIFIDSSSVKVYERNFSSLKVYPNPADKELIFKNEKFKIGTAVQVSLYNLTGEEVKTIQLKEMDQSISVADLPEGFYTGRLSSDNVMRSFSFVVQH